MGKKARIRNYIPLESIVVTAPEHTFTTETHALRADAAGTCKVQYAGDPAGSWRDITFAAAGDILYGYFSAVRLGSFGEGQLLALVMHKD